MNKNVKMSIAVAAFALTAIGAKAQMVSTFDDLSLPTDSFYNGKDGAGKFKSGDAEFVCKYDTSFGGYWSAGFAYTNKKDSTTEGYLNIYSAITANGYKSANYAIGQQDAILRLDSASRANNLKGVYITNSTYAALSMKKGDFAAKKFGGSTGNDPDFFLLTIYKYSAGVKNPVGVNFYLADYRSVDNSKDYIVKDWTYVDLSSLGQADSLQFTLTSSDIGQFGINTPTFFAIDEFNTATPTAIPSRTVLETSVYPNPVQNNATVVLAENNALAVLTDLSGQEVFRTTMNAGKNTLPMEQLAEGMYVLTVQTTDAVAVQKIVKQ